MRGGYVVVDLETTGFNPKGCDRIVEIAAVHVDDVGRLLGEWSTLVNPLRDVGPVSVHGIAAGDVLGAPTFADLAPMLIEDLAGRTVVAHNARFDLNFLTVELRRAGYDLPTPLGGLCTMEWARVFLPRVPRRLESCCAAAGVTLDGAHSALGDARATAALLGVYLDQLTVDPSWEQTLQETRSYAWPVSPAHGSVALVQRGACERRRPGAWVDRLTTRLPRSQSPDVDAYLELLDRALLDASLSLHEESLLLQVAEDLGLTATQVREVHRTYLASVAVAAWADGVVTPAEHENIRAIAQMLGLAAADADVALAAVHDHGSDTMACRPEFRLEPGDRVVFTGDMQRPREEWIAVAGQAGLEVGAVTKRTKLVIAADPDSLSGKARKARDYGIPIVGEETFGRILESLAQR
ncbi:exonuclease domain-containing protein [Raineyella sp. LH-20]|uniref:exonuclease domain-containing protein n=1 Tax=Raineyella sp. LH-20 TaxID=3081204 RepID=UPI0029554604|nr:exonuclease domain-containing protein [Raineyella sp. LH-20]WOP19311.1 exonuclease domain-containing protein [Raineyella sp. LH-20]